MVNAKSIRAKGKGGYTVTILLDVDTFGRTGGINS